MQLGTGLHSFGLHGLHRFGLHRFGLHGLHRFGLHRFGLHGLHRFEFSNPKLKGRECSLCCKIYSIPPGATPRRKLPN